MRPHFPNATNLEGVNYTCGWCGRYVTSTEGWRGENTQWQIHHTARWVEIVLCPSCRRPTFLCGPQFPGVPPGEEVDHLPDDVNGLYREIRQTAGAGAFTAAILLGRKLLMHVAVDKGAEGNKSFKHYVDWLASERVVTEDMKEWIDEIRELGNDATHEVTLMESDQADALITFLGLLLKLVYEYPERGRRSVAARKARAGASETPDDLAVPPVDPTPPPPPTLG